MSALDRFVEKLDALAKASVSSLFEWMGLTLQDWSGPADGTPEDHDLACSLGFIAPKMHGAVLMTTRRQLVASAWPKDLRDRTPSESDVCDWAGELVNQLLGRVKNGLVPYGVVIEQGTPTVVLGWQYSPRARVDERCAPLLVPRGRGVARPLLRRGHRRRDCAHRARRRRRDARGGWRRSPLLRETPCCRASEPRFERSSRSSPACRW